ncbi:N-acetylmuramoyl-L-alanine amidase/phosphate transport system substrate-binding protein [Paenibacillus taihuensis]|uniref:N-acetylmuramoyl-L-alanine amidase/phosphate transport system substrate-binding protein n=1 Tax=Paenibacillus taihuensis TaxID=1156355 RepID=A0A3D9SBY3_9BACL|nr:copper amine oxidase N-terminal domain-containing protein [Paenibacillus taihuensis]REE91403.1 N-acetylmuramoyl-L-alanine amidase/phosphate transport system substrate-binding protein [Paenibacillus taihuensis]
MKRIITLTAALSLLAASPVAHAAKPSRIVANERTVLTSVPSIVENGRTLVPLRVVAEALGAYVSWDAKTRTADVRKWTESIAFKPGSKTATAVYGSINPGPQTVALDAAAVSQQGRVYVPLRMIAVSFG